MKRLGVEISVFIDRSDIDTAPNQGVLNTLKDIFTQRFKGNVWLLESCDRLTKDCSETWLNDHKFLQDQTGIRPKQILFARDSIGMAVIASALELTHFVGTEPKVLNCMAQYVRNPILFKPDPAELLGDKVLSDRVKIARGWEDVQ